MSKRIVRGIFMKSRDTIIYFSLKYKGDWEKIFNALSTKEEVDEEEAKKLLTTLSTKTITILDDDYPETLKTIFRPPFVLYYYGNIKLLDCKFKSVAVVGARKCTEYGLNCTDLIVKDLCKELTIISGLALGIDARAHECALNNKGNTIAVLGSGINRLYPTENLELYERIKKEGLVISEYPEDTEPTTKSFPARNRIVAGLTNAAFIPEAKKHSGSSITATLILNAGGYVCCCPNRIPEDSLCNFLIKYGARLTETAEDVFDEICYKKYEPVFNTKIS